MGEECIYPIEEAGINGSPVGITITKTGDDQFHCGLAFRLQSGFHVIHLAWHHRLEYSEDRNEFTYWIRPNIHPIRQMVLSAKCDRINKMKEVFKIPYALLYDESAMFDEEGLLHLGNSMHGLTCATFVLAVFKSCGFDLIDTANWPVREEDKKWHKKIVDNLAKYASAVHLKNVTEEVGCSRFKPEEVAMSSTFANFPATFEEISKSGESLRNKFS